MLNHRKYFSWPYTQPKKLSALHKHIHHPIISHHIIFKTPSPTHFYSKPNRRAVMEYQKLNTAQNLRDCSCIPHRSSVVLTSAPLGIKTHQMNLRGLLLAYTYQRRTHAHIWTPAIVLAWRRNDWNERRAERASWTSGGGRAMKLYPKKDSDPTDLSDCRKCLCAVFTGKDFSASFKDMFLKEQKCTDVLKPSALPFWSLDLCSSLTLQS